MGGGELRAGAQTSTASMLLWIGFVAACLAIMAVDTCSTSCRGHADFAACNISAGGQADGSWLSFLRIHAYHQLAAAFLLGVLFSVQFLR